VTEPSSARDRNVKQSSAPPWDWERDAAQNLSGLQTLTDMHSLPPITWTIDRAAAAVIGKAATRYEWDRWLAAVTKWAGRELYVEQRSAGGGDVTHLTVLWERYPHPVDVVITADISC